MRKTKEELRLVAHLQRRAGFGATSAELDHLKEMSYAAIVDDLLDPSDTSWIGDDLIRRFHHEQ